MHYIYTVHIGLSRPKAAQHSNVSITRPYKQLREVHDLAIDVCSFNIRASLRKRDHHDVRRSVIQ